MGPSIQGEDAQLGQGVGEGTVRCILAASGTSGTFLASEGTSSICPGHDACFVLVGVVPNSACRGVCVEAEEVVETVLGGVLLGEHPAGSGASPLAFVEEHGLFDAGKAR